MSARCNNSCAHQASQMRALIKSSIGFVRGLGPSVLDARPFLLARAQLEGLRCCTEMQLIQPEGPVDISQLRVCFLQIRPAFCHSRQASLIAVLTPESNPYWLAPPVASEGSRYNFEQESSRDIFSKSDFSFSKSQHCVKQLFFQCLGFTSMI